MYRRKIINRVSEADLPGRIPRGAVSFSARYYLEALMEVVYNYPVALLGSRKYRQVLERIQHYVMFIGYARSGHSLIGALLDAHPEAVCAIELGTLKYLYAGYSKYPLFYLLMKSARLQELNGQRIWGYQYRVKGQYQGNWKQIKVIGDKQGGGAVKRLKARPWLLNRLRRKIDINLHFIHVVRNPFDNIRSMSRMFQIGLDAGIDHYFMLCDTILEIKKRILPHELIEFRHEDFLSEPKSHLLKLCRALGLLEDSEYIQACSDIVWSHPRLTRKRSQWSPKQVRRIMEGIDRVPYLRGYEFK